MVEEFPALLRPESVRVSAVSVDFPLAKPIEFGTYRISTRQYCLCRADLQDGTRGLAWGLTRGAPVASMVESLAADALEGHPAVPLERLSLELGRTNPAVLASGVGQRAVSLVELALLDAICRKSALPVVALLGRTMVALPATAVIGFPPTQSADAVGAEVAGLAQKGWRRFKLPVAPTLDLTVERLRAAREAAPNAWLGLDLAWTMRSASEVADIAHAVSGLRLGWLEDAYPPGDQGSFVRAAREGGLSAATGDDDGGPYFLSAALQSGADVVRVDATCQGGYFHSVSMVRRIADCDRRSAPHMFASVHRQVLSGAGVEGPVEYGSVGNGVDPFGDLAGLPSLEDGRVPASPEIGFGRLHDVDWLLSQEALPRNLRTWLESE